MKLAKLAATYGYDSTVAMFEASVSDAIAPATCTNAGCDFTVEAEPDAAGCVCEECGTPTVASCLRIAGLI